MTLQDLVAGSADKHLAECLSCGEQGEDTGRAEFRCTTNHSQCEILYWFKPEYNRGQKQ